MAQLHEHQAKEIFRRHGIETPRGFLATTPADARRFAAMFGGGAVVKAQIHSTSRAAAGGVRLVASPEEAALAAAEMLGNQIAGNLCQAVLIEEKIRIEREFYLGFIIDTALKRPTLLFSEAGGSGVEERADSLRKLVCSTRREPTIEEIKTICPDEKIADVLQKLYRVAKACEARTAEINPLAFVVPPEGGTTNGVIALDARISVDDYAVFRHPELEIEIARELGHAPTPLERIAWEVEKDDFRGTFYFVEILEVQSPKSKAQSLIESIRNPQSAIRIGFHGAGGGGSMASLDAAQAVGLQPACYVDTSGNPPASKVYRAARIILSIPHIKGYFLSGSGVASQEQFVLARAVIKAFREVRPAIPAVLRLGGNGEEYAKELVEKFASDLDFPVEAYQKKHSADFCAARLRQLIENCPPQKRGDAEKETSEDRRRQTADSNFYSFKTRTGRVFFDHEVLSGKDTTPMIESCPTQILSKNERGLPVLNIAEEEAARGKCVECLACEFAAWEIAGTGKGAFIEFPIEGL